MKKIVLILFLFPCVFLGQNKIIDSLNLALKNAKHDTTRCSIYLDLGEQFYLSNPDSAMKIYCETIVLAESNIKSGTINNFTLRVFKGRFAAALTSIAVIYYNRGDIPNALEYYHRGLKICEENDDKQGIANSLNNLASLYVSQNELPKALEYYIKSFNIREAIGDKKGISQSLNNLGTTYEKQGDMTKALECFQKSLKIREELGDKRGIANSLNNIGVIYDKKGDQQTALEYHHKSLKIREDCGFKVGMVFSLNSIARIERDKSQFSEALLYANRSMQIARGLGFPSEIKNSAKTLRTIYQAQNKFKEALEMYELEIKMRDSINNQATQKETVKKEMQYVYDKKELEAKSEQDKKDVIAMEEKQKQQIVIYAVSIGLILVMLLALFVFRGLRQKQRANVIITVQKEEVEKKNVLLAEKQREIIDSIHYARRIQSALITPEKYIDKSLNKLNSNS